MKDRTLDTIVEKVIERLIEDDVGTYAGEKHFGRPEGRTQNFDVAFKFPGGSGVEHKTITATNETDADDRARDEYGYDIEIEGITKSESNDVAETTDTMMSYGGNQANEGTKKSPKKQEEKKEQYLDFGGSNEKIDDVYGTKVPLTVNEIEDVMAANEISRKGAKKQIKALGGPKFSDKEEKAKEWGVKDPGAFVASRMDKAHGKGWRKKGK